VKQSLSSSVWLLSSTIWYMIPPWIGTWIVTFLWWICTLLELKRIKIYGKYIWCFGKTMTIHSLWAGDSEMSHLKHILLVSFVWARRYFLIVLFFPTIYFMLVIDHVQGSLFDQSLTWLITLFDGWICWFVASHHYFWWLVMLFLNAARGDLVGLFLTTISS